MFTAHVFLRECLVILLDLSLNSYRGAHYFLLWKVFHIMKVQRVGMDEAAQALTVSKAMKRAMKDRGISAVEAIDDLTKRLSLANFSIFSDDEVDDRIDEMDEIQCPRTPTAVKRMMNPVSATTDKQRTQPPSSRKCTSSKKSAKVKVETLKGKNPIVVKPSRKRAIEQEGGNQVEPKGRARSDSVTEVVNAKMAAVDTGAVEASKPVVLRGKRRVPEDSKPAAAVQPMAKRPRAGEA